MLTLKASLFLYHLGNINVELEKSLNFLPFMRLSDLVIVLIID